MRFIFKKPFIFLFFFSFLLYVLALYVVSDFSTTFRLVLQYADSLNWGKLAFSFFLSLAIGFFVAVNICYVVREYAGKQQCRKGGILTTTGLFAGLSLGVCPLCIGGFLPLFLALFGITFSFGSLPFAGIEIQLLVLALMITTTYMFYNKKI
ncbi:MAG: hypothetical protein ACI83O_000697 [Patescibacteria group bacterium]|jgi:hypothetical protein